MQTGRPDTETIASAIDVARRAPSLHNTQPWRWLIGPNQVDLYCDTDRMLPSTDAFGRQMVISCGAALDHFECAMIARGWSVSVHSSPSEDDFNHLAAVDFAPLETIPVDVTRQAEAIARRRSNRSPLGPPPHWSAVESTLRRMISAFDVELTVITGDARAEIGRLSTEAAQSRHSDFMYQDELAWWTGVSDSTQGVPPDALASGSEHRLTAAGRRFPVVERATDVSRSSRDEAVIAILSTAHDSRSDWLKAGQALSAVLLECTARGLATCPLTHITELPSTRAALRAVADGVGAPQVLVRIGVDDSKQPDPAPTPRRASADVYTVRGIDAGRTKAR